VRDTIPTDSVPKKDSMVALNVVNNNFTAFQFANVRDTVPTDSVPKKDSTLALNIANMNMTANSFSNVRDTVPTDSVPKKDSTQALVLTSAKIMKARMVAAPATNAELFKGHAVYAMRPTAKQNNES
jgi:hypothetical protein